MWGFYNSSEIHDAAMNARVSLRYTQAYGFAKASYTGAHYLGHFELESYDPLNCSMRCDEYSSRAIGLTNEDGQTDQVKEYKTCRGINVYFERSPALHLGPKCKSSPSRTIIKCALWGESLDHKHATNTGYTDWGFDVVIAGSNGYNLRDEGKTSVGTRSIAFRNVLVQTIVAMLVMGYLACRV
jgi:hypothetical protein